MKSTDPARMTAADRVAELGELLAAGVQRHVVRACKPIVGQIVASNSQEQLDAVAAVEAPCGSPIEVPE